MTKTKTKNLFYKGLDVVFEHYDSYTHWTDCLGAPRQSVNYWRRIERVPEPRVYLTAQQTNDIRILECFMPEFCELYKKLSKK